MSILKYFNRLLIILLTIPYALCVMGFVFAVAVFDSLLYVPTFFMLYGSLPKNTLTEYMMDEIPEKTDEFFQCLKRHNLL